mmetsp:Transcript_12377/g.23194  ORF Transcript_12377/g.23194 Transcript_12377/m.23194 type:complete len:2389 (-) Transcript_12377:1254-8420(-)|eukprot:CAMPEP_0176499810 /NCGR_PEP_ID=MMETSP0200_2-20121128/13153_1 /TAXON_ID=947934 /ORGANISM="Chaetoceros sp., Strain GSL56" /LENGTH=2388 /DNA_ID=CAMNT_0017898309 /DNA_START=162 /DNA_END=7328 /DNA_ORIENTATION=+
MVLSQEDLAQELENARRLGLPLDWTLTLDNQGKKRWTSPGPKFKSFSYLQRALDHVRAKSAVTATKSNGSGSGGGSSSNKKRSSKVMLSSSSSTSTSSMMVNPLETKSKKKSKKSSTSSSGHASSSNHKRMHTVNIDPETSLDIGNDYKENPYKYNRLVGTVHWDPDSEQGQKVGHRIRVWDFHRNCWKSGRIVRYDPVTHRHKIVFFTGKSDDQYEEEWLLLSRENVQLGGRFVWALVKGFAWWPAQVLHCSFGSCRDMPKSYLNKKDLTSQPMRDGYVLVEFFDSDEVASIKDSPDFIRDFQQGKVDDVIRKNKKKINASAVETARQEEITTREVRNDAARFYAEKAFECVNRLEANHLLGSRVEIFRNDINYPVGEYLIGVARIYSTTMKKFLVAYDPPPHNSKQYEPSWVSFTSHKYKVLDDVNVKEKAKGYEPSDIDLYPFLFGHEEADGGVGNRCRGCVGECNLEKDTILTCSKCRGVFHPKCLDPPLSEKMVEQLLKSGEDWNCSRCIQCIGCREYDIAFGTKTISSPPSSLFLPRNTSLRLCNSCLPMYENEMFCPICAHVWDDSRYEYVQKQLKIERKANNPELGSKRIAVSDLPDSDYTSKDCADYDNKGGLCTKLLEVNDSNGQQIVEEFGESSFRWKLHHEIKDSWFYPENNVWGYNEGTMLSCEKCNLWVHAACAALTKEEYDKTTRGEHPVYSREYLCRKCCQEKCLFLMNILREEDSMYLFAEPVTDQIAHNYSDVIKNPMDLRTMSERAISGCYRNYSWLREAFELMVYNALLFNPAHSKYWNEAKRYYLACKKKVFSTEGKGAPASKYKMMIKERFDLAEKIIQAEKDRIKADETAEKKDLVAGDQVLTVDLSTLVPPPDPPSCIPTTVVRMTPFDAFYCTWLECCFSCGSSGALDTMLFCVDCGEAYHSFCASAPIHSMNSAAVEGWRCPNCKVCEITGEVTTDELKLLYCEMCDRAFSIDSIDPPLTKVPSGLWICGQCVDCKKCNNSCDAGNVSRKYWSRHPSLCLPCGGCDGLNLPTLKDAKCSVCKKYSRSVEGLAKCSKCKSFIHSHCDSNSSNNNMQNNGEYCCPICLQKDSKSALKTAKGNRGKKDKIEVGSVSVGSCVEDNLPKVSTEVGLNASVVKSDISVELDKEKKGVIALPKEEKCKLTIPKNETTDGNRTDSLQSTSGERDRALRLALKDAQSRGLPDGWVCVYGSTNRKKWRSPPPDSRIFDSLPKALRYAKLPRAARSSKDTRSLRRFKLNLDSEAEWHGKETNIDENTSLMTDAEVIVRILEARIGLEMTRMFDPTGEWYTKSTHIHHIPKFVLSRAARFVRFVKRLRSEGATNKQPKTAPTDSSAQLVVCKMASAFLYSICIMFKIDMKSEMTSWKKILSLLTPFDATSGTVNLDAYIMKFSTKQNSNFGKLPSNIPGPHVRIKLEPFVSMVGWNIDATRTVCRESANHEQFNGSFNSVGEMKPSGSFAAAKNDVIHSKILSTRDQSFPTNRGWLLDKNESDMNAANALITLAFPSQSIQNECNQRHNVDNDSFVNGATSVSEVGYRHSNGSVHLHSTVEGLEGPHLSVKLAPTLNTSSLKSNSESWFESNHVKTNRNSTTELSKDGRFDNNHLPSVSNLDNIMKSTGISSQDMMKTPDHIGISSKDSKVQAKQNNATSNVKSGSNADEGGNDVDILNSHSLKNPFAIRDYSESISEKVDDKELPSVADVPVDNNAVPLQTNSDTIVLSEASKCHIADVATDRTTTLNARIESSPGPGEKDSRNSCLKSKIDLPWFTYLIKKVSPVRGWDNRNSSNSVEEETWFDPRTCSLCNISGDDDAGIETGATVNSDKYSNIIGSGRLLPLPSGEWVHCGCATWSSEVWETPSGGMLRGVGKARGRGGKLRCFGCGQYGATLGCHRSACNANFHFPCAKACGATFTSSHKLYCAAHTQYAKDEVVEHFSEPMKILRVGEDDPNVDSHLCYRSGSLIIHSLGKIDEDQDGFHSKSYITPSGFTSTRIFWSFTKPKTRTVYVMRIVQSKDNIANFIASAADAPTVHFKSHDVNTLYNDIIDKVCGVNKDFFSHGDLFSVFPMVRSKTNKHGFCLNGPQFFGFGVDFVREALETSPSAVACAVPLTPSSCQYQFCFQNPSSEAVMELQRKRAAVRAERALENTSGCARTEGSIAFDKSKGSGRITRALVRKTDDENISRTSSALTKGGADVGKIGQDSMRELESIQAKYREMKSVPMEERLAAKRSHIHGWGLFAKIDFPANSMIAEYMGEGISQPIADKREKKYEVLGMGSCYMFRLDLHEIVDATSIGCMARFMNHCCAANAYAKVISVNTDKGQEKKIVVFANQEIKMGDEITYDYKFPVEDGSLRCTCGAPNCIGRMN